MYKDDGTHFRDVTDSTWSAERRVEDCDKTGVSVHVLSTVPVMFSYWARPEDCLDLCQILNDHVAAVVRGNPKRFVGLGTLPMQSPELAIQELRRCVRVLGLAGVEIGSHVNDMTLADPALFPIFKEAEELGACIFVHPWDMVSTPLTKKYWMPWLVGMPAECCQAICSMIFGGVLERLPGLRVLFAHGGGSFPATIGRIQHGFDVRPDLCAVDCGVAPRDQLGRFYCDSLVHDPDALRLVVKVFGEDKVCLGTDYPFPLGEFTAESRGKDYAPGTLIDSMEWEAGVKDKLLSLNACNWLGVTPERFL